MTELGEPHADSKMKNSATELELLVFHVCTWHLEHTPIFIINAENVLSYTLSYNGISFLCQFFANLVNDSA